MSKSKVSIGVSLNNRGSIFLGEVYNPSRLIEGARLAEVLGFDSVWIHDDMLVRPRYEAMACLGAVSAVTSKVKLCTGILVPQLRNPVWLALQTATLDVLSSGRMLFGLGLGGPRDNPDHLKECKIAGYDVKDRGIVYEESIELLKRLWTEEHVTFNGKHYRYEDITLGFRPHQKPHPPLYLNVQYFPKIARPSDGTGDIESRNRSNQERMFRRAARIGNGVITQMIHPEECPWLLDQLQMYAAEYKRSPNELGIVLSTMVNLNPDHQEAEKEARWFHSQYTQSGGQETRLRGNLNEDTFKRWYIVGSSSDCIKRLEKFVDSGVKAFHLVINARDQLGQMTRIANEVLPSF